VVPHGVDTGLYHPRVKELIVPGNRPVIFSVITACHRRKNIPGIIRAFREAFRRSDNVQLEIITSSFSNRQPDDWMFGCLREAGLDPDGHLRTWADAFPSVDGWRTKTAPTVAFSCLPQTIPDDSIALYLRTRTDVYVCASHGEGFCLPGLEAMACGHILVMPDRGGHREYFEPGKNGLSVLTTVRPITDGNVTKRGFKDWFEIDHDSLVGALQYARNDALVGHSSPYRQAARETALAFTWEKSAEKMCDAVKALLDRGGGS